MSMSIPSPFSTMVRSRLSPPSPPGAVLFDDLGAQRGPSAIPARGQRQAPHCATDDDDAFLLLGLFAEDFQRAVHISEWVKT